jgi:hypothetical protein
VERDAEEGGNSIDEMRILSGSPSWSTKTSTGREPEILRRYRARPER